MLQNAGVNGDEKSVNWEEAASTSSSIPQGRSISSKVAALHATGKDKFVVVRNQIVLQNKTATITSDENKLFGPGGEQDVCTLSSRLLPLSEKGWMFKMDCTAMV